MAYCTLPHVEAKCIARAPFTTTSKPSASQVAIYIDEASAMVDAAVYEAQYDVPVPMGTTSVASAAQVFLQSANAQGAAWMTERYAQNSDREKDFQLAFETALNMIKVSGLPGYDRTGQTALARFKHPCGSAFFSRDMQL